MEAGATIISLNDPEYPSRLKEIYDPPVILFVKGSVEAAARSPVLRWSGRVIPRLTAAVWPNASRPTSPRAGLVIISGLARGIDTASHRGAIAAKGKTVAVLGTGIDVMYPKENTRLTEQIVALGGALISEFPVGTSPAPQNFPIRNRIISGMSAGVLVVEAAEYSGTRITSRLRARAEPRCLRRPGQRDQQEFLGSEHADQAGSEAGRHLGRRMGRASGGRAGWRSVPGRMNPRSPKPHLYSRTRWPRPTKKRSSSC